LRLPGPTEYDASEVQDRLLRRDLAPVRPPAVVLFQPHRAMNMHLEPVYNDTVAWPDDAGIVKAQNLGREDVRLFDYYARHQPDRTVWLYDRGSGKLTNMGNVADLARRFPVTQP
jgi:hypothetical protein